MVSLTARKYISRSNAKSPDSKSPQSAKKNFAGMLARPAHKHLILGGTFPARSATEVPSFGLHSAIRYLLGNSLRRAQRISETGPDRWLGRRRNEVSRYHSQSKLNDKGRYRQQPETTASQLFQGLLLVTEIPRPSFTASCSFCLLPIYRSVVCTDAWPSRNWICSSSPPELWHRRAQVRRRS